MNKCTMTQEELRDYLKYQMGKFNDWIWCFGIDTGMNLRDKFTEDELVHIFVMRYGSILHDEYFGESVKNCHYDFGDGLNRDRYSNELIQL